MFEQTFVETVGENKKPAAVLFSLMLQSVVICLLALLPLLYTEILPGALIKTLLVAPAPPRAVVPEPLPQTRPKSPARTFDPRKFFAPVAVPKELPASIQTTPVPEIGVAGSIGETNGLNVSGVIGLIGSLPEAPAAPPAVQSKDKPARQPVRFGGRVAEANLIRKVLPIYPPLARSTRVQGTVEFTALISKEGNVENLQLVHGHPLLIRAAREAVLQWRYRPTLLNGEPVEVVTNIVVNFTLSQ